MRSIAPIGGERDHHGLLSRGRYGKVHVQFMDWHYVFKRAAVCGMASLPESETEEGDCGVGALGQRFGSLGARWDGGWDD